MKRVMWILLIPIFALAGAATAGERCISVKTKCPDGRWVTSSCESTANPCGTGASSRPGNTGSGANPGAAIGTLLGNEVNKMIWGDPQKEAAQRAEAEMRAAQIREEQERQAEDSRQRLLGTMKSDDSSLTLKGMETAPELSLKLGDTSASSIAPAIKTAMPDKPNDLALSSQIYSKGFEHASSCISQNAGTACAGITAEQQQACVSGYRAGYDAGSKKRHLVMEEAIQAGRAAGAGGGLANGASDARATGPCRTEWIEAYNRGYFQGRHTK